MTTADKILELVNKINQPVVEEIAEEVVTRKQKKKIANVVTNLIGYKLDTKI